MGVQESLSFRELKVLRAEANFTGVKQSEMFDRKAHRMALVTDLSVVGILVVFLVGDCSSTASSTGEGFCRSFIDKLCFYKGVSFYLNCNDCVTQFEITWVNHYVTDAADVISVKNTLSIMKNKYK